MQRCDYVFCVIKAFNSLCISMLCRSCDNPFTWSSIVPLNCRFIVRCMDRTLLLLFSYDTLPIRLLLNLNLHSRFTLCSISLHAFSELYCTPLSRHYVLLSSFHTHYFAYYTLACTLQLYSIITICLASLYSFCPSPMRYAVSSPYTLHLLLPSLSCQRHFLRTLIT